MHTRHRGDLRTQRCFQVKPGTFLASRLPEGLDAAVVEELAVRQSAGDGRAAKAMAALRCRGVFPGRERPKPALPRPWQQELAAAAGRPFDPQAPSRSAEPPLEPWLHGSGAPAAPASAREASAARRSSSTGSSGPAYSSGRDGKPGWGMADSIIGDKVAPVRLSRALWWRRRAQRKRLLSRTQEAMQALPPLKHLRAALLPMMPSSAQYERMHLRPVAAVVEAASSFAAAADSRHNSDQTFQLLAYDTAKSASAIRSKAQAADAADTSGVVSSKQQSASCVSSKQQSASCVDQGNRSLAGISTAKQAEGASQPHVQAKPIQAHDSSRRLAFQPGSGFASGGSTAAKQRQGIPDLTRLMCSADTGSEHDSCEDSTPVMQDGGKHGRTQWYTLTPPSKCMLFTSSAMHHLAAEWSRSPRPSQLSGVRPVWSHVCSMRKRGSQYIQQCAALRPSEVKSGHPCRGRRHPGLVACAPG